MRSSARAIWSPVEDEWTIILPNRLDVRAQIDRTKKDEPGIHCPFCPGSAELPRDYEVVTLPSKHPVVTSKGPAYADGPYGDHQVLLYTSNHYGRLVDQSVRVIHEMLSLVGKRTKEMMRDSRIRAVYAFESHGDEFGPTVAHPHGQIVGLDFTPRRMWIDDSGCPICSWPDAEHLLIQDSSLARLQISPWARLPFEMAVTPVRHVGYLSELRNEEREALAFEIKTALLLCSRATGEMPPYLLNIMQSTKDADAAQHLRIEIVPLHKPDGTLKRPGAMELGAGIYLNPLEPARAANILRKSLHHDRKQNTDDRHPTLGVESP
ncbi:DUF4931 domain-containing protein [Acrocarpospora catenulata]|uniref:DUF4931 domain-containing protein n=1 Tax=Acrocarpospora catenulata TaxID=2836182 RepID=UPI001BDAAD6D|nr:DUF4931 domain-containing protein [Acrocarpospora catenulata]